jgi:DNA-binding MarR family transcriptional regulator
MGGSRWLSATQQHDWRAYIQGSAKLTDALERDLKIRHGLSLAEYEILVQLSEAPERRLRMAELAASASQSRSRLTHTVARLEYKGFVTREDCASDRRGVFARLTEEGFLALAKAAVDHVSIVRDLFVDVVEPDDLQAIGRAFRAVAKRIE